MSAPFDQPAVSGEGKSGEEPGFVQAPVPEPEETEYGVVDPDSADVGQAEEGASSQPQREADGTTPTDVAQPELVEAAPAAPAGDGDAGDEAQRYLQLAQRTQADFDNYRKRMSREVASAEARGIKKLARELLPAVDNLGLALAAAQAAEGADPAKLHEGVALVQAELQAALGRAGVEAYSPEGEPFDPNEHEAMAQQPAEGVTPGTVTQVYQAGYRVAGTVLRPARVVVAA